MAPSSVGVDDNTMQQDNWGPQDEQSMGPGSTNDPPNGASLPADDDRTAGQGADIPDFPRGSSAGDVGASDGKSDMTYREKQVKVLRSLIPSTPNKVYIGGLPEHTTQEDLQSCFGKIGNIVNIELKIGYGFVEFDSREAAEESVAKYHEGYFMGNKIRVELSRGGGRTAKYTGDPGACFKCGQMGHWARECPNSAGVASRRPYDSPLIDRIQRDYPPRNVPPRDDPGRYPPRDVRYDYPPREYRRPPSPREIRDYPPPPPPGRGRDFEEYRRGQPPMLDRDRYPPPPPELRGRYPPDPAFRGYGGPPSLPPPPAPFDRYERRPNERYAPYPPQHAGRPRTPPLRVREEYDRVPPPVRDYEYRGRPSSPPPSRYPPDYSPRGGTVEPPIPPMRYRRRSESPPHRAYDQPYPSNGGYGNGYSGPSSGGPPPPGPPPRGGPPRDYLPPRARDTTEPGGVYRRH